jgi:transcriptional regulator with XRE-family HTH domain
MRDRLLSDLRAARKAAALSQAALAAKSGAGRVTIARLEAGALQDFRVGTLARLCEALGLELAALPRGAHAARETLIARERERARRLDLRRRHAVLAARLLAAPPAEAVALVQRARGNVERWKRERLCSEHYISRWRARLAGSPRRAAAALLEHDEWTDALLQSSPWSFALGPPAAA